MRFLRNKEENVSKNVWFFLAYTVCFAIIAGAVFSVFIINKKSFYMGSGRFAAAFQCAALLPFLAVIDPGYAGHGT